MNPVGVIYDGWRARADRPALIDGDRIVTHGELIARVDALAADLHRRGLDRGRRIGLCAANNWRHVVAYLAILRAGAVWVPLNPRNGPGLNADLQRRAELDMLFVDQPSREQIAPCARRLELDRYENEEGQEMAPNWFVS